MTEPVNNVQTRKTERDAALEHAVASAYKNRAMEHKIPELGITEEMLELYEKFNALLQGKSDDEVIDSGTYEQKPHEVIVTHSHEYLELLRKSVRVARPMWKDDADYVEGVAQEMFEHEMEHAVPEIGYDQSRVIYGIHFYEDVETGETNFFPFVFVEGKTTVGRIRDSMTNVDDMSEGDQVIMNDDGKD